MTDMTQAELDEAMGVANDYRDAKITGGLMGKLARAVLHLAARQMPALRWDVLLGSNNEIELCFLGNLKVGSITFYGRPSSGWAAELTNDDVPFASFSTKPGAMAAVEAAVRKELGIGVAGASVAPSAYIQSEQRVGEGLTRDEIGALLPNAIAHPSGDLKAVVAKLEAQLAKVKANQCGACRAYDRLGLGDS